MRQYVVKYYEEGMWEDPKKDIIVAKTKEDAYWLFVEKHPTVYGAWVDNYTTQRGDVHYFNAFCGKPF